MVEGRVHTHGTLSAVRKRINSELSRGRPVNSELSRCRSAAVLPS